MDTNRSFRDSLVRIVAFIGLLLVLILGAWGIILLAFNLPTIASNVGNSIISLFTSAPGAVQGSLSPVTVTAPESVASGASLSISWAADDSSDYVYSLSYACQDGLALKAATPSGSYQTVACATPFNYTNASNKMTLIPSITGSAPLPLTVTVAASKTGGIKLAASGSATISVKPASTASTGGTSGTTYVPANRTANLYGYADLAVRITSINSLSSVQGRVAVQFEVENIGTNVAAAGWMFNATLPVGYAYTYSSATQQALYPGDKIVYTLGFSSTYQNQYCTMQYPNPNCPWYQQPYQPYPYQGTCYRYDGYQNTPVPCTNANGSVITYGNTSTYNYNGSYYNSYGQLVTITVDPQNRVYDLNRANNAASIASPIVY
jgi:hypothetical protein